VTVLERMLRVFEEFRVEGVISDVIESKDDAGVHVLLSNGPIISFSWRKGVMRGGNSVEALALGVRKGFVMPECSYELMGKPEYILVPGFSLNGDPEVPYLSIEDVVGSGRCVAKMIEAASEIDCSGKTDE
jgi:hypothetical protein